MTSEEIKLFEELLNEMKSMKGEIIELQNINNNRFRSLENLLEDIRYEVKSGAIGDIKKVQEKGFRDLEYSIDDIKNKIR